MRGLPSVVLGFGLALAGPAMAFTPGEDRLGVGQSRHPPTSVQSRADGIAAFKSGRFATAARVLEPCAEAGDADAQLMLGTILGGLGELGVGDERMRKDLPAAAAWLDQAASQGNAQAMLDHARMADLGEGMPQDLVVAFRRYAGAAQALPEGPAKARALAEAGRLAQHAEQYIAQFPPGDREAKALAQALEATRALAAKAGFGTTAATAPDRRP